MSEDAVLIEQAVKNVLSKGFRTPDIKKDNQNAVTTKEMGKAVVEELNILSGK